MEIQSVLKIGKKISKFPRKEKFYYKNIINSIFRIKCGKAYFKARASRAIKYVPHVI